MAGKRGRDGREMHRGGGEGSGAAAPILLLQAVTKRSSLLRRFPHHAQCIARVTLALLRQSLAFLNTPILQQPEMYLSSVGDWFDENGKVKNDQTRDFLASFAKTFADWIEKVLAKQKISEAA